MQELLFKSGILRVVCEDLNPERLYSAFLDPDMCTDMAQFLNNYFSKIPVSFKKFCALFNEKITDSSVICESLRA